MNRYATRCEQDARRPTGNRWLRSNVDPAIKWQTSGKTIEQTPLAAGLFSVIKSDVRHRFIAVNGAPSSALNARVIREIFEHSRRTGAFMVGFARSALVLVGARDQQRTIESQAQMLGAAALFHDVGKFAIPSGILGKPCKLGREEFDVVKRHPSIGAQMIGNAASRIPADFGQTARVMASFHHEHWDGSGYPFGLSGFQIPFAARLLAIVDVYDALAHERVYKCAQSHDEAIRVIGSGRGKLFDPALVDIFVEHARNLSPQHAPLPQADQCIGRSG